MKLELTRDELFEIEKHFDYLAGLHLKGVAQYINDCKDYPELINGKIQEFSKTYDTYRSISLKCKELRNI